MSGLFLPSGAPQREVYFMGLIDVLTQYDTKKKAAHAAKTVKHGVSGRRAGDGGAGAPTLTTTASVSSRLELKSPQSTPSSTPNDSVTSSPTYSCSFPFVFFRATPAWMLNDRDPKVSL